VSSIRESTGEVKSRRLIKAEKTESFTGLPKGSYFVAEYETSFTYQPKTREVIVLTSSEDGYGLAAYEINYNKWSEALSIIGNGLFVVFFIMCLLAFVTWGIGKIFQKVENSNKKEEAS